MAARFIGTRHPNRITQVLLKKRDDLPELWITAGLTDGSMKLEVFVDTVTACTGSRIDRCEFSTDIGDLRPAGPLRGQCGNFSLDDPTHFDNLYDCINRLHYIGVEGERPVLAVGNENASTLA